MTAQRGFTLLESVVAITILVLGLIAAMQLTGQGVRASNAAIDRAERVVAAERLMALYDITGTPPSGQLDDGTPYLVDVYPAFQDDLGAELPEGLLRIDVYVGEGEIPLLSTYRLEPRDG